MTCPTANLVDMTIDPDSKGYRAGFRAAWGAESGPMLDTRAYRVGRRHGNVTARIPDWMFWRDER